MRLMRLIISALGALKKRITGASGGDKALSIKKECSFLDEVYKDQNSNYDGLGKFLHG